MIFANFNLFGRTPVFIIWFVIRVRGLMIDGAMHLSKMVDTPSIPILLLFVELFITVFYTFLLNFVKFKYFCYRIIAMICISCIGCVLG